MSATGRAEIRRQTDARALHTMLNNMLTGTTEGSVSGPRRTVPGSATAPDAWRAPPSELGHVARRSAPPASLCPRPRDVGGNRGQRDPSAFDQLLQPWSSRLRSRVIAVRVRSRSRRIGSDAQSSRSRPWAPSCANRLESETSLLRPGSLLTWPALTSITFNPASSSR
jgi:hypothetical protein